VGLGPRVIDWVVVSCDGDEEVCYRVGQFSHPKTGTRKLAPENCMTRGPGPPCHRLGCLDPRCSSRMISCSD
jgi:hypothetical protein